MWLAAQAAVNLRQCFCPLAASNAGGKGQESYCRLWVEQAEALLADRPCPCYQVRTPPCIAHQPACAMLLATGLIPQLDPTLADACFSQCITHYIQIPTHVSTVPTEDQTEHTQGWHWAVAAIEASTLVRLHDDVQPLA
jgi:hypothetical protein